MLYKITCAVPQKEGEPTPAVETYAFDNQTNEIFGSDGKVIDFREDPRFEKLPRPGTSRVPKLFSRDMPIKGKDKSLAVLKIQLGMACNYHCSYCMQAAWRKQGAPIADMKTLDAFFDKLDDLGVTLDPEGRIELWGGEPLVYWKLLQVLVPRIRETWGEGISVRIITNGSLLTRPMVDFFIKYRVSIIISHDGPGFSLRNDVDPLTVPEIKETWLYLLNQSIKANVETGFNVVITPKNADVFKVRDFFRDNFSPMATFGFEGIVTDAGAGAPGCQFSKEDAKTLDSSIFKALIFAEGEFPSLEAEAMKLTQRLVYRMPVDKLPPRCETANRRILEVDLYGRVNSCHNRPSDIFTIGSINDWDNISNDWFTHWSLREVCGHCLVLSSCSAGCPHLTNAELKACCANEFIYHSAIFGAVWYRLTGKILLSALPVIEVRQVAKEEGQLSLS